MSAPSRSEIVKTGALRTDDADGVFARTLTKLASAAHVIEGVWKRDAHRGDWVIVKTKNSTYTLAVQDDLTVVVAGGWFARASPGEGRLQVSGCTWGGSAILTGMLAAPGMCIEFSNGVRTTRVRDVQVIRDVAGRTH
jgi:hypothetical protein